MMIIISTAMIPVVLLLVFVAVLSAVHAMTANCPQGERVHLDDLMIEEDNS